MNRLLPWSVLALALLLGVCQESAWAQTPPYSPYGRPNYGPYSRPPVSPYLNILRGNNPAINYYTGVIPERENRARFNQVNSELQNLERRAGTPAAEELIPTLAETGHPVQFLNLNPYYGYGAGFNPGAQAFGQTNRPGSRGQRR
ncbi:MAG TPA: hypothetical protein VG013_05955 [Gemmataceae bacterium]|nr:hypothetical protein [Gemmataceae bacterium]